MNTDSRLTVFTTQTTRYALNVVKGGVKRENNHIVDVDKIVQKRGLTTPS